MRNQTVKLLLDPNAPIDKGKLALQKIGEKQWKKDTILKK
jgi:hypothetical protein